MLTLALGIGATASIFTLVNALLLRPLPVERPDELVHVYTSWEGKPYATSSYPDFMALRDGVEDLSALVAHANAIATLQHDQRSEVLMGEMVSGDAFRVLGITPRMGRALLPEDDRPGAPRVVVLGHGLWQRRFGGDPNVVGRTVRFNGEVYEVVGVAPDSFPGLLPGVSAHFWVPVTRVGEMEPAGQINAVHDDPGETRLEQRGYRWLWLKGRLSEGAAGGDGVRRVEAQVDSVMARVADESPLTNGERGATVLAASDVRLHPEIDRVLAPAAIALMVAVALVLLVVCANLASMLLARAEARRSEVAVRLALGASRGRLIRQLLAESFLVAAFGGLLAVVVAWWTTRLLAAWSPPVPFSVALDVGVDGRVLAFTAVVAFVSAVAFGLVPSRQAARRDLISDIRGGVSDGGGGRRFGLRSALVVAQVAVTVVFLVAAALLGRGLLLARGLDPGFAPERVAALGLPLGLHGYDGAEARRFFRQVGERAATLPGVAAASVATRVPFDINVHRESIYPEGAGLDPDDSGYGVDVSSVDGGYFDTLDVSLLAGRTFGSVDRPDSPLVAVVSAALARRFWDGPSDAVGRRFRVGGATGESYEVVGVAPDVTVRTLAEEPRSMVYFARSQRSPTHGYLLASVPAGSGEASRLLPELRRAALDLDPEIAFTESTTLAGMMDVTLYPVRIGVTLLGIFGVLALTLACLGLYGVIAYSVTRRRREMGVRLALGAERRDVIALVLRSGMALVAMGALVGLGLAAGAGQFLESMLYGGSVLDPWAFGGALAVLLVVALVANYLPAARAARTDPVTVLKQE